jgi:lipopolysaccharide export system permease protein
MKRLDRYIARSLMSATLLTWLVVVMLEGLFAFLGELGDIGRGHYGWQDAMLFVLLSLPAKAWQSFPMAVLIGTLLGLGNLAAQGELNAFRLAGCSPVRLGLSVLLSGILMLAFALPFGEGLAPAVGEQATRLRAQAIFADVGVQGGNGFWVRRGRQMIQVGRAEHDGSLSDIHRYTLDEQPQLVASSAVASAVHGANGWTLAQVSRTRFDGQDVTVEYQEKITGAELVDPQLARLLAQRATTFSLPELMRYIDGLEQGGMQVDRYRLEFWQRLAAPLNVLAMLLLSVAMVLGPLGQQGMGLRVLAGVLLGLLFKLGNETAAHAGLVYGSEPWFAALLPSLLVFAAATILVRRAI